MANSRIALEKIFDTVDVLAQQGAGFRGHETDNNSWLMKMLRMRAQDVPQLDWWLGKILNQLLDEIKAAKCFSIIVDETANISRKEQVSISFRITTLDFEVKKIFIGFYHTPNTKSSTLLKIVEDVPSRYNLQFCNLRGQCYEGAAAMSGKISGLQKRVREIEPRALYVHCTAHSLNRVAQDAMKNIDIVNNFVGVSKDLINFVRDSPKPMEAFKDIQLQSSEKKSSATNLSSFCPTRWCMRVKSLKTIVSNYETILSFLEQMKAEKTDDSGKADGFLKYLESFEFYFLSLCTIKVLERIVILNKELQKSDLCVEESHEKVKLVLDAMLEIRECGFDTLWENATANAKDLDLEKP
ncbi:zinc finger MYM-type protein 1-like [Neodiprion virginianus]|uniref:zinc finger MYM-type protein 1-like n=1 Tax=Neodiprion virginianus TaxID=2961670 RepID=UPI001EE78152|nr:zinc finger MYM-type protein 1-like [Neodiprion virginianus]